MQLGEQPPNELQRALAALKIKNVEELLNNDHLSLDSIAKTTNNHRILVQEYLAVIHKAITKPFSQLPSTTVPLQPIFHRWLANAPAGQEEAKWSIGGNSIVEIVGRANGGKSHFLNEMIVECIKAKQKIIYLDSNQNMEKLAVRVGEELERGLEEKDIWMRHWEFRNMCELAMLLHCLGNQLLPTTEPYFIFIDSLGRSEELEVENNPSVSNLEFKFVDKFKRLLVELAQKVGTVVYATKCSNSNVLFAQNYRIERHRPKWVGSTPKQWDTIADKTFCVDYTRTAEHNEYWKMVSTKATDNRLITLTRKSHSTQ